MSYNVEKLDGNMAKFTIEVEDSVFEEAMKWAYNKNKSKISIPGFRKGKAPRKMLEKMYGPEIFYEDAANHVIPDAYEEAVKDCDLEIVSRPEIDVEQLERDKSFIFTATVALKPEVELVDYKNIEVTKIDVEVTDEDIENEINKVREQNSRMLTIDDGEIVDGDIAVIDYEGFVDDVPFEGGKGEDYSLTIGSKTFIPGFEDQLLGKKSGDDVDVNVTFPDSYHDESLEGKDALFKVTIKEVHRKELPEVDDEFASEVSDFDTMDEYKESLKKSIEERKTESANNRKENEAIDKLAKESKIDVPAPMIDETCNQMMNEFAQNLAAQGLNINQYMQMTGANADALKEQMKPDAERRIRARLVLEAVAKAENIEATQEDIDARMQEMADGYQIELEKLKEILGDEDNKQFAEDIKVQKAAEMVGELAKAVLEPETEEDKKEDEE